jgi:hypothetical protein
MQDMEHTRHMVVLGGLSIACCSVCYKQNDMITVTLKLNRRKIFGSIPGKNKNFTSSLNLP